MTRFTHGLPAICLLWMLTGCAESSHQIERMNAPEYAYDPGYAGAQNYTYWNGPMYGAGYGIGYGFGPGYWGRPYGYYGFPYGPGGYGGLGWYGGYGGYGGFGAARPHGGAPAPRPALPPNASGRFKRPS